MYRKIGEYHELSRGECRDVACGFEFTFCEGG